MTTDKCTALWKLSSLTADNHAIARDQEMLASAAQRLNEGGVIAFPTETVYGLGADARDDKAVAQIFHAKGRPTDNPLIVHIADVAQLDPLVEEITPIAQRLMTQFWPGPLTIIFPLKPGAVSPLVSAGLSTVAIRMPAHEVALRFIQMANCPIAAPSANRSGRPSPTTAKHVWGDLECHIDGVIDAGPTGVGIESTVVSLEIRNDIDILRPGGITVEQIQALIPEATIRLSEHMTQEAPRAPGMKYTHYAPRGHMRVVSGTDHSVVKAWIESELVKAKEAGERTGVLTFDEYKEMYQADVIVSLGSLSNLSEAARQLYAALRQFDDEQVMVILADACELSGMGVAVMNRLQKACGNCMIQL